MEAIVFEESLGLVEKRVEVVEIDLSDNADSESAITLYSDSKARASIVVEASPEIVDFEEESVHSTIDLSDEEDVKS